MDIIKVSNNSSLMQKEKRGLETKTSAYFGDDTETRVCFAQSVHHFSVKI